MSSVYAYEIGDVVVLTAVFKNLAGELTDPTAVSLKIRIPCGTVETASPIEHNAVGTYSHRYILADKESGIYHYRWEGTGNVQAATESSFYVAPSTVL